jgi:hypothetical protein
MINKVKKNDLLKNANLLKFLSLEHFPMLLVKNYLRCVLLFPVTRMRPNQFIQNQKGTPKHSRPDFV